MVASEGAGLLDGLQLDGVLDRTSWNGCLESGYQAEGCQDQDHHGDKAV